MQRTALGLVAIVLLASTAPAALATTTASAPASTSSTSPMTQSASGYAGSTVSFDVANEALVDYSVGGTTVAESIRVQSQNEARTDLSLSVSADLGAVVNVTGAPLSIDATAGSNATIRSDSGATLQAHDDAHGSLVVESDGESQYVEVGVSADSNAEAESENRVVVTTDDGTEGAFVVVGDGNVTVNDDGNVSAALEGDGRLVFRPYADGRDDQDRATEDLIANGTAAASVYATSNGSGVASYADDISVNVTERSGGNLSMAVERTSSEGRVVIASVGEQVASSAEEVAVTVDGEAAAEASSDADLRQAANGGDTSMYMVQESEASASADVLVAVNHFSTREIAVGDGGSNGSGNDGSDGASGNDGSDADDDESDPSGGTGPGFGVVGALLALVVGSGVVLHRRG